MKKLSFIGAGKMAEALLANQESPDEIVVADMDQRRLSYLKKKYKVKTAKNNSAAFNLGEIVILAVKPQDLADVLTKLGKQSKNVKKKKLIISIAAGVPLSYLRKKLPNLPIVRAMPNNPCLVRMGITALVKGKGVSQPLFREAERIFQAVGDIVTVPEKWLDAVTGLSGSGPAYVYNLIHGLTLAGVIAGLPQKISAKLTLQTVLGAAATVAMTGKTPQELQKMVTSKGGTTIEGLEALKKQGFQKALIEAVIAASKKSRIISKKWTL